MFLPFRPCPDLRLQHLGTWLGRFPLGAHDSNYRNHAVEQHRKIMLCLPGAKRVKRRKHVNHTIEISWHIHLALLKTFITSRFKKLHCLPFSGTCRLIFTHLHWPSIPAPYFTFFCKTDAAALSMLLTFLVFKVWSQRRATSGGRTTSNNN